MTKVHQEISIGKTHFKKIPTDKFVDAVTAPNLLNFKLEDTIQQF